MFESEHVECIYICRNSSYDQFLQLDCPVVIAAIFISGIGGTFQYGFSVSVMTSPSPVSSKSSHIQVDFLAKCIHTFIKRKHDKTYIMLA